MHVTMIPPSSAVYVVGDMWSCELHSDEPSETSSAVVRTTLGQAEILRQKCAEPILYHEADTATQPTAGNHSYRTGSEWRDIAMTAIAPGVYRLALTLSEVGHFEAKPRLITAAGQVIWPEGENISIQVHPAWTKSHNSIYCCFPRMFGPNASAAFTTTHGGEAALREELSQTWEQHGYTVIPPSGTLRQVQEQLPHIVDRLGCRILHLLPVSPTPTTMAKFGRFGSPYATQHLTHIDPALVEFDQASTGVEQFCDLTRAMHARNGRVILDIVINHTGWGSDLYERHPEWFVRDENGTFTSPGAWGTIWEDLVELHPDAVELWRELAAALLVWCERGVDGFRCDAGYMIPLPVWQCIIARIQLDYPDTVFLLEGLGGAWQTTEDLLRHGSMQWAYSELFQNYSGEEIAWYLDYSLTQHDRNGTLVHYSETHDNSRLAAVGKSWSLLRNRLCAMLSHQGAWGFTNGVEWLAQEQVNVHSSRGMNWGADDHICQELRQLNQITQHHPAFFAGARCRLYSADRADTQHLSDNTEDSSANQTIYMLERQAGEAAAPHANKSYDRSRCLVVINTTTDQEQPLPQALPDWLGDHPYDLISEQQYTASSLTTVPPGAVWLFSAVPLAEIADPQFQQLSELFGYFIQAAQQILPHHTLQLQDWRRWGQAWNDHLGQCLATCHSFAHADAHTYAHADAHKHATSQPISDDLFLSRFQQQQFAFQPLITWEAHDRDRIAMGDDRCWWCITLPQAGRVRFGSQWYHPQRRLLPDQGTQPTTSNTHPWIAVIPPQPAGTYEIYFDGERKPAGQILVLSGDEGTSSSIPSAAATTTPHQGILLTNGRGGMCRMSHRWGEISSKYDAILAANLDPAVPCDRHVLCKRLRAFVVLDGVSHDLQRIPSTVNADTTVACWRWHLGARHAHHDRSSGARTHAA